MRTNDVAGDEVTFLAGHLIELVGVDEALAIVEFIQATQIAALTDGGHNQVAFDVEFSAFDS